jgi:hypothetical protein
MMMPVTRPNTMAIPKPTTVVMAVCAALSRIGTRHCHIASKITDGAGRMNCGKSNTQTANSQNRKSPMTTAHGMIRSSVLADI